MQNPFRLRFLLALALVAPAITAAAERDIGEIVVNVDPNAGIPITITSNSPELQGLADLAFNTHGAFRRVASGGAYTINFAAAGASQVTVTISKGSGGVVHTQTVSGTSLRNALLRAADVAVTRTSKLRGYFAGKLAFVGERTGKTEVYTSDLFFGDLLKWTSDGKQVMGPRWSPQGDRIVFTSYRTTFPDIYVLELGSRRISLLASFKGTNSGGRFSPNGQQAAMVLSGEGNSEVYVGNASGRQLRRLTKNQSVEASPVFSPDGTRLLFTSDAPGRPQLYMVPVTGGAMTRVTSGVSTYCAEPDWSAFDPNKIVFTAAEGRGYRIAVWDLAARSGKIIAARNVPLDAVEPVWLADGRHVICTFRSANVRYLVILDTESGKAVRLSPTAFGNASGASYLAQ